MQLIGEDDWEPEDTNYGALRTKRGLRKLAKTVDGIGPWVRQLYRHRKQDGRLSDKELVRRAHDAGLVVHPFTFRSDELPPGFRTFDELLEFMIEELSIDGLFTDFPDAVQRYLARRHDAA